MGIFIGMTYPPSHKRSVYPGTGCIAGLFFLFLYVFLPCYSSAQERATNEVLAMLKKSKPDAGRVSLLLETAMSYVLRPGAIKGDLDSAFYYTDRAMELGRSMKAVKLEGACWCVYSAIYREAGDSKKGRQFVDKAIDTLLKYGANLESGDAYIELANYFSAFVDSTKPPKIRCYEQAQQLYERAGEKLKQASTLKELGDVYLLSGEKEKSLAVLNKALILYKQLRYPKLQGVYDLLSTASRQADNYKDAIKYGQLAVQTAESLKDSTEDIIAIYNRLGLVYYGLKQFREASIYFKRSMAVAMKFNDTTSVITIAPNVINSLNNLDSAGEALRILKVVEKKYPASSYNGKILLASCAVACYVKLNDYKSAKPYVQKLLAAFEANDKMAPIQKQVYSYIIAYFMGIKQYSEVVKYCSYNDSFYRYYELLSPRAGNYQSWYKADSAMGNYAMALGHYQQGVAINDSIFNATKTKEIAQLQVEYETQKKEQNIKLLTKQGQLKETQLEKVKLTRNIIIGGTAMLALLLGVSYNRYRLKQRSNLKLEAQQLEINLKNESLERLLNEKEWLIKEIHHRVKNNLQIVMSLLDTQSLYLDNEAAKAAILESQHRMQAMSLIHQKLYQSDSVSSVDMLAYIKELAGYLLDSFDDKRRLRFEPEVDVTKLEVGQAIPVGLILNEAITNAVKYAFPADERGTVKVVMKRMEQDRILFSISDDGIGLPANFDISKSSSLGMSLMQGLANQLGGTFKIANDKGVKIEVEFPLDKVMDTV